MMRTGNKRTSLAPSPSNLPPKPIVTSRRARDEGGFTMMELLMTMLLLTVVLVGLAALQVSTIRQVSDSELASEATRLAERRLEYWRNVPMNTVAANLSGTTWDIALNQRDPSTPQLVHVDASGEGTGPYTVREFIEQLTDPILNTNYYQISVQVLWTSQRIDLNAAPSQQYASRNIVLATRRFQ